VVRREKDGSDGVSPRILTFVAASRSTHRSKRFFDACWSGCSQILRFPCPSEWQAKRSERGRFHSGDGPTPPARGFPSARTAQLLLRLSQHLQAFLQLPLPKRLSHSSASASTTFLDTASLKSPNTALRKSLVPCTHP
jgi:hypothetical protein